MAEQDKTFITTSLKKPAIISLLVHGVIILVVIFGLPYFKTETEIIEPVPIDLVADISELTSTNKPPVKAKPVAEPKEEKPVKQEPPKPEPQKELPKPEVKSEVKPEPLKPEEPTMVEPEIDETAEVKKDTPKPEDTKKPEPKPEEQKDFDSLLKNLSEDEPKSESEEVPDDSKLMTEPSPSPDTSRVSDVLSMSEQDALRQQLAGCWNIMAGAMNAEDLAVEVRVVVNPDRTVASAEIIDKARYNSDTFFRTMAESALRAVKNPRCSPLRLPPDKYNLWNKMTIVFDPKEMF
jgi:outer membrane biosynthesis protein TonB